MRNIFHESKPFYLQKNIEVYKPFSIFIYAFNSNKCTSLQDTILLNSYLVAGMQWPSPFLPDSLHIQWHAERSYSSTVLPFKYWWPRSEGFLVQMVNCERTGLGSLLSLWMNQGNHQIPLLLSTGRGEVVAFPVSTYTFDPSSLFLAFPHSLESAHSIFYTVFGRIWSFCWGIH